MNSFLDSETLRERERREGRPKMGSPVQSSGPNLALRDGQGFRIRPLFSACAKGAESGVKGRQIVTFSEVYLRTLAGDTQLKKVIEVTLWPGFRTKTGVSVSQTSATL
jgi:hypothetical protein